MVIYIGSDHRGYKLKESLKKFLQVKGYVVVDVGAKKYNKNDDYPDFAAKVAKKVRENPRVNRGIVLCGSGEGVEIVANKFKNIRAALVSSEKQAYASRNDDDTNVLALAADFLSEGQAKKIAEIWFKTAFSGEERHKRRLKKIAKIEN